VGHRIHLVDVFTEKPLAGNQLAVVLDAQDIPGEVMQRIAREMNFSETTFVMPPADPAHAARVRIFTPATELLFAGHPTIGTAWVLSTQRLVPDDALEFTLEEGVGPVHVRGIRRLGGTTFWMTHPKLIFGEVLPERAALAAAIGVAEADLLPNVPAQVASTGNPFLFVGLRDVKAIDRAVLNQAIVKDALKGRALGAFIFASVGGNRLYSRMFSVDIPEDPATGSGAGPLGAFVVKYGLVARAPKVAIVSEQGTKIGRQSFIHIELEYGELGDIPTRIDVGGSVRPVLTGTLEDFPL
jgi:trans-2,3-dihydro-3-hydroxyanthranilate isomerase